jgi:hypothetical protein
LSCRLVVGHPEKSIRALHGASSPKPVNCDVFEGFSFVMDCLIRQVPRVRCKEIHVVRSSYCSR